MKRTRILVITLALLLVAAVAPAQTVLPWFGTQYQPGNTAFSVTAAPTFDGGLGVAAYPAAEYIFAKVRPANLFSVDFGVGARGVFSAYASSTLGYLTVGGAPVLSIHGGLRGFEGSGVATYLDRLDFFSAFGLGFQLAITESTAAGAPGTGLVWMNASGLNYFFTDSLGISLSSNYVSGFTGGYAGSFGAGIGVIFKLGPAEEVGDRIAIPDVPTMTGDIMYANFSALYWASIALGGYLPSDETFEVGDGIRFWHRYESAEDDDINEMEFTRALLHESDDSQWWRLEFLVDDEDLAFEALIADDGAVERIQYLDPGTEEVVTHTPSDEYLWQDYQDEMWTEEELEEFRVGSERVTVPAGTFRTDRLETTQDGASYTWWISDEVPGRVVKFEGTTEDDERVSGELREIYTDYTSPWEPAW